MARFYPLVRLVVDFLVLRARSDRSKDAEMSTPRALACLALGLTVAISARHASSSMSRDQPAAMVC